MFSHLFLYKKSQEFHLSNPPLHASVDKIPLIHAPTKFIEKLSNQIQFLHHSSMCQRIPRKLSKPRSNWKSFVRVLVYIINPRSKKCRPTTPLLPRFFLSLLCHHHNFPHNAAKHSKDARRRRSGMKRTVH
jgi:hypothetical protein